MNPEKTPFRQISGPSRWMAAAAALWVALAGPLAAPSSWAVPGGPTAAAAYASPLSPSVPSPREGAEAALLSPVGYMADFDALRQANPEVCGWILQEGTSLSYPVVRGTDNQYYQTRLFTRKYDRAGSIFMDAANAATFGDRITWLYGHNRQDGAMFASLPEYMDQAYADAHSSLILLTPGGDYQVDVFASVQDPAKAEERWAFRQPEDKEAFEAYVEDIRKASAIHREVPVAWGDKLLALCAGTPRSSGDRYIVFGKLRPLTYDTQARVNVAKMQIDALKGVSKKVMIPGRGELRYYAQNDPIWDRMRYESLNSNKGRPFGQGGCAPTAFAMVLGNLATDRQLQSLTAVTREGNGFTFCPCSVNQFYCSGRHLQYKIETVREMRRYLPVVVASFASGNNLQGYKSRGKGYGTGPSFMQMMAEACGLGFRTSSSLADALDTLAAGGLAVVLTTGWYSPFTDGGHYLVLVHADEEYLYFLDSYLREDYAKTDRWGLLTVLEPGVVRANRADAKRLNIYDYYLFRQP